MVELGLLTPTTSKVNGEVGDAARQTAGELIKNTPPRTWYRRAGGQLKTSVTTITADLEPLSRARVFGYARWRKGWMKVSHRTDESGVPPSVTWPTGLMVPAYGERLF